MTLQIVQEKIPFRRAPKPFPGIVQIKIDRECGDPLEFLAEIWQRLECFDLPHNARHVENIEQLSEKRRLVDVEAKDGMPSLFRMNKKNPPPQPRSSTRLGTER